MPSTDSVMQPISAPILVPGTQQEPTKPTLPDPIDTGLANSHASGSSNGSPTSSNSRTPISSARLSGGNISPSSPVHSYPPLPPNNSNPNSGLRRFASIGTKKINVENTTLKAKVVELERYVAGMKEELILAHRQIRSLKSEIKTAEERKTAEMEEINQHAQKCEFELGAKIVECEALYTQLKDRAVANHQQETLNAVNDLNSIKVVEYEERIIALEQENAQKDNVIAELLQKVDCLGTEVLNLEREKARLEGPASPAPVDARSSVKEINTKTAEPTTCTSCNLKGLAPITAEAIIAATTPTTTTHNLTAKNVNESNSSLETSTSPDLSIVERNTRLNGAVGISAFTSVNSVGYNVSQEHSKLLAKFQALSVQHAQTSEYLGMLENENQDLRVQILGISDGHAIEAN